MSLGQESPVSAFCILCHDADAVLPFYCDVLGFEPRRAEESFYHFARRGSATALCLWEIGHVAGHTAYTAHPETAVPNKIVLSLTLPTEAALEDLSGRLSAARIDRRPRTGGGFYFIDPCAVVWSIEAGPVPSDSPDGSALGSIGLICRDLPATKAFYEDKLGFPSGEAAGGRVSYPAVNRTALILWDVDTATSELGIADFAAQRPMWRHTTAMLANSFGTIDEVRSLYERLSAKGVSFDEAPAHFEWDFRACYFRDPEDNIWELFEVPSNIEARMLPQNEES